MVYYEVMSVLIRGGVVYDGTSKTPKETNILIRGKTISRLERVPDNPSYETIDAAGCEVVPGLFDVSSDLDQYLGLFSEAAQRRYVERGITSVIGGNFGVSLAPFYPELADVLYRPEDDSLGNVHWNSMGEYMKVLRGQKLFLNFGTFAGYVNLIHPFLEERGQARVEHVRSALRRALHGGALGLSLRLQSFLVIDPPVEELEVLSRLLAEEGKMLSVRVDGLEGLSEEVQFLIGHAGATGVRTRISHVRPSEAFSREWKKTGALLEVSGSRSDVFFDFSPMEYAETPVYRYLPLSFAGLGFSALQERVMSEGFEKEILDHLGKLPLRDVRVGYVPSNLARLRGRTLNRLSKSFGMSVPRTLLQIMRLSRLRAVCVDRDLNREYLKDLFLHSESIVSPNGILALHHLLPKKDRFSLKSLRSLGEEFGISFGDVLSRITSRPARAHGFADRGVLRESAIADILVLEGGEVRDVLVGGEVVMRDGEFSGRSSGEVLTS